MKTCFKCFAEKPLSEFYKHPRMADGHLSKCKACTKADVAERESRLRRTDLAWLESERERCRVKQAKANALGNAVQSPAAKKSWGEKNRVKIRAHVTARRALASGEIVRKESCESCGSGGRLQMHHTDYTRPKHVTFLCTACHGRVHRLENLPTEIHIQPTHTP